MASATASVGMLGEVIGKAIEPFVVTMVDNGMAEGTTQAAKLLLVEQGFTIMQQDKNTMTLATKNSNENNTHCHID